MFDCKIMAENIDSNKSCLLIRNFPAGNFKRFVKIPLRITVHKLVNCQAK